MVLPVGYLKMKDKELILSLTFNVTPMINWPQYLIQNIQLKEKTEKTLKFLHILK